MCVDNRTTSTYVSIIYKYETIETTNHPRKSVTKSVPRSPRHSARLLPLPRHWGSGSNDWRPHGCKPGKSLPHLHLGPLQMTETQAGSLSYIQVLWVWFARILWFTAIWHSLRAELKCRKVLQTGIQWIYVAIPSWARDTSKSIWLVCWSSMIPVTQIPNGCVARSTRHCWLLPGNNTSI